MTAAQTLEAWQHPAWGLAWWCPDVPAMAVFGARLIDMAGDRLVMLPDRKSLKMPDELSVLQRRLLMGGIDVFWKACKKVLLKEISPYHHRDDIYALQLNSPDGNFYTCVATQNSSHGYVYMSIWVTEEQCALPENSKQLEI